jgi:multiple sugar transport system permease protein
MSTSRQTRPTVPPKPRQVVWRYRLGRMGLYTAVVLIMVWTLAPYAWMVISSLAFKADLLEIPAKLIPDRFTLDNYRDLFGATEGASANAELFLSSLRNSAIIATSTTALALSLGIFAAYAVTRVNFPGRRQYLFGAMSVQMVPPIAIVIPMYVILRNLGILDTYMGLVLVYMSLILPLAIWMLRSYFASIPRELEEAAMIDGATRVGALLRVTLPLAIPGVITVAVFAFVVSWNEYLYAFVLTNVDAKTLPVLIGEFSTKLGLEHLKIAAAGVVASLPPLILAFAFQRYLIRGMTAGAVK